MTRMTRLAPLFLAGLSAITLLFLGGCPEPPSKTQLPPRFETYPLHPVPAYLQDTLLERCDIGNLEPFSVSGFGLVVNLRKTGSNEGTPSRVRNYFIDEMLRHGFETHKLGKKYKGLTPEIFLSDPRVSIVTVSASIPPGIREGALLDVFLDCLPQSQTTALTRGELWGTQLSVNGANALDPYAKGKPLVRAQGQVWVSPYRAVESPEIAATQPLARRTLRAGRVLGGGQVLQGRPIYFRLRVPQNATALAVQKRIRDHFGSDEVAVAQNEAIIHVFVPEEFRRDWDHFARLVLHLYVNHSPERAALRARELALRALDAGAPLDNISYALEGLGAPAITFIRPLYANPRQDVAFAMARAGAMLRDPAGELALGKIAQDDQNPYQLNAARILTLLPTGPRVNRLLEELLDVEKVQVRIEAYLALARRQSPRVFTRNVNEQFLLDSVPCNGKPLVFATRMMAPRIAILGKSLKIENPVTFTSMGNRLTLHAETGSPITIFYRDADGSTPAQSQSGRDLTEVLWRLGGGDAAPPLDPPTFELSHAEVVGIANQLVLEKRVRGEGDVPASFVMQTIVEADQEVPGVLLLPNWQPPPPATQPTKTRPSPTKSTPKGPGKI